MAFFFWYELKNGAAAEKLSEEIKDYFGVEHAWCVDSARSGLYMALAALGVEEGDEVLVQGYTCIVVSNAVIATGATPIYVDIDQSLNMVPRDFENKITNKTKAAIIQYTFGSSIHTDDLISIAQKYKLATVNDCAQTFRKQEFSAGGDISVFSFGRSKALSCGRGGVIVTANQIIAKRIQKRYEAVTYPRVVYILQQFFSNVVLWVGRKLYGVGVGKVILWLGRRAGFISRVTTSEERQGRQPEWLPAKLSNALAAVAQRQLADVEKINNHRKRVGEWYKKYLSSEVQYQVQSTDDVPMEFLVLTEKPGLLQQALKKHRILADMGWAGSNIAPATSDLRAAGYEHKTCSKAEELALKVIGLPTHHAITEDDVERIVSIINEHVSG